MTRRSLPSRVRAALSRTTSGDAGFTVLELLVTSAVLLVTLGVIAQVLTQSDGVYDTQEERLEARDQAAATLDMLARLVRQARQITPDPDNNGLLDSIRIVADWNPRDGDTADPYETITFTTTNGVLLKQEPADAVPVPFADHVASLTFTYLTPAGAPVPNPATVPQAHLGFVTIAVQATPVRGQAGAVYATSASVRRTE